MLPSDIRNEFPLLRNDPGLVFLDSAASAQKPQIVLDGVRDFLEHDYSNIHRGAHFLAERSTTRVETVRKQVAEFLDAKSPREIIFGKNATEMINLVARTFGEGLPQDSAIFIPISEHHSNIVPWLQLRERMGISLRFGELSEDKKIKLSETMFEGVSLVVVGAISNVLGVRQDLETIIKMAHQSGAKVLIDAAQLVPHEQVSVQKLDADFLVFSGHKMYGPSGVGVLWAREELLREMPPFLGGGEMISEVRRDGFLPSEIPHKFEAGTPPIAEIVGLGKAIEFCTQYDFASIGSHSAELARYCFKQLSTLPGVRLLSSPDSRCLVTFSVAKRNFDLSDDLSDRKICVRVGQHCTELLHDVFQEKNSVRASFGIYNTQQDAEVFCEAVAGFVEGEKIL